MVRSKRQLAVSFKCKAALTDLSSSICYINIQPIPLLLQPVFKNISLEGSNRAKTSEDVIQILRSLNNVDTSEIHAAKGISFL